MKYLFGPVNSRRFGRSLGIDLLPAKVCTMNCVYCECGQTDVCTDEVQEYVPTEAVIGELDAYLADSPALDAITFAGSGEPTLHSGMGDIIDFIKKKYPLYRVVVLTNGSLLWREDVRARILHADVIVPSLDAVSDEVFKKINRPGENLHPEKIIEGLVKLREVFSGKIFLEVFILPGINDDDEELSRIRDAALRIRPDVVQLNTLDRPGAVKELETADRTLLEFVRDFFKPLPVDIIGGPGNTIRHSKSADFDAVIALLRRRPSTKQDIIAGLGVSAEDAEWLLEALLRKGIIARKKGDRGEFYYVV
jgi:wyosine [tRNA(Phe)-imidazoG37] synthetase (radical SAM superfamily)